MSNCFFLATHSLSSGYHAYCQAVMEEVLGSPTVPGLGGVRLGHFPFPAVGFTTPAFTL